MPLAFHEKGEGVDEQRVLSPLWVGVCELGVFACERSEDPGRNRAAEHLLGLMTEALGQRLMEPAQHHAIPAKAEAASRLLRERFQDPLRLGDVARELGISRERLSRLFHRSLGVTFSEYLNLVRLNHCRQLLRTTDMPVTRIAFASGFQSLSQFNRRFKASEGMSPSEYRDRHAGSDMLLEEPQSSEPAAGTGGE
jgi:transcriptional regulator GlxA family with amidase domain